MANRLPVLPGLMQDFQLTTNAVLQHAKNFHGDREIVTNTVEGPKHRYTYADLEKRAGILAHCLRENFDVKPGDIIGTMAWNTYRHMEIWYAVMGIEAVVHTLNPRLFPDQLSYIANHAGDKMLFFDFDLTELVEKELAPRFDTIQNYIIMTDKKTMPRHYSLPSTHCYEDLLAATSSKAYPFPWPEINEQAACALCYTSGTTGNPKGVLYSHRSQVLIGIMCCTPACFGLGAMDTMLPVVPMFHANAWAIVFAGPISGCKLALPGSRLDGPTLHNFFESEGVTCTAAVPTVWLALLQHLKETKSKLTTLNRVVIGGSACPPAVLEAFENVYGVEVRHAWGMTELSPIGTVFTMTPTEAGKNPEEQMAAKLKQGRPIFGVEMKITDDDGKELPRDGKSFGHLMVRGPMTVKEYMRADGGKLLDEEGWFDTGDVAVLEPEGLMRITDRSKDVIKSGGEWISSIEIENEAVGHPQVAEAAVIGVQHPKWGERPLLVVVKEPNASITKEDVLAFLVGRIAKWWMPDDVVFAESIPHTATGKIAKKALREQFEKYTFPKAKL
ncbi:hypothetical protein CYMTET_19444 [Cymbomonas tetramitiformis]|uniref:Uncharacterized protein n=1 Tax=Cymbomonas tetramitiformis TaxID=36881 RepID=A0AAE0G664_9CHLO|nr:hypothetical protein CYMTET_19444 [Cymbomonas tetramitiformis]